MTIGQLPGDEGASDPNAAPFNGAALLADLEGQWEMVEFAVATFARHVNAMRGGIRDALTARNRPELELVAHRFRGSLLQLQAARSAGLARAIEAGARSDPIETIGALLDQLDAETRRLETALQAFVASRGSTEGIR